MTREELKIHCEKQVEQCQMWAKHNGEEPSGKIYEEHKLILELLEQESILYKIRAEIEKKKTKTHDAMMRVFAQECIDIIDKYGTVYSIGKVENDS